jgi:hypothetical protein
MPKVQDLCAVCGTKHTRKIWGRFVHVIEASRKSVTIGQNIRLLKSCFEQRMIDDLRNEKTVRICYRQYQVSA